MKNTDYYPLNEEKLIEHIKIDTYYPNYGAGGQHCGMDNGISITFKPLNLCIKVHEFRSQHKNKAEALKILIDYLEQREDLKEWIKKYLN